MLRWRKEAGERKNMENGGNPGLGFHWIGEKIVSSHFTNKKLYLQWN